MNKTLKERLLHIAPIVTGASGFWVVRLFLKLRDLNKDVLILSSKNVDLRDQSVTMHF